MKKQYSFKRFWNLLRRRRLYSWYSTALSYLLMTSDRFCSYDIWEKKPARKKKLYIYQANKNLEPIGIIIQGPIKQKDNFTLETIKYYRKIFPTAVLIVSTWNNEDKTALGRLKALGAYIVTSDLPEIRGVANVNCQIKTTLSGIYFAEKMGLRHVLKTRSDQRIYAWNALRYLLALEHTFPVSPHTKTQERLIIANEFTRRFTPFHFSDFLMFGTVHDLKLYWEQPFSQIKERGYFSKISEVNEENCAERFLSKNFAAKIMPDCQYTIPEYYSFLRDYFCIVDLQQLDLYWHWGQKWAFGLRFKTRHFSAKYNSEMCIDFSDWLYIYQNGEDFFLSEEIWKKQKYASEVVL